MGTFSIRVNTGCTKKILKVLLLSVLLNWNTSLTNINQPLTELNQLLNIFAAKINIWVKIAFYNSITKTKMYNFQ